MNESGVKVYSCFFPDFTEIFFCFLHTLHNIDSTFITNSHIWLRCVFALLFSSAILLLRNNGVFRYPFPLSFDIFMLFYPWISLYVAYLLICMCWNNHASLEFCQLDPFNIFHSLQNSIHKCFFENFTSMFIRKIVPPPCHDLAWNQCYTGHL